MDIKQQILEVEKCYPLLAYSPEKNEFSGEIFISDSDSYQVKIELNPYPSFFPSLYETEERIPNKPDRHIYTNTGSCCLTTNAKSQILLKTKIKTIKCFIKEIVIPYLQNNSYYEINKCYKTSEYDHYYKGVIDGYKDILHIDNELLIVKTIHDRLINPKLKIHQPCYCGSNIKLKKCTQGLHDRAYRDFKLIDKQLLINDLEINFKPFLKEKGLIK
jgi:hypothetical protein